MLDDTASLKNYAEWTARKHREAVAVTSHASAAGWGEFIAGGAAGVAITFVSHPFDTAKVLLQNGKFPSAVQCMTAVVKQSVRTALEQSFVVIAPF
jgi:hypothetical protein